MNDMGDMHECRIFQPGIEKSMFFFSKFRCIESDLSFLFSFPALLARAVNSRMNKSVWKSRIEYHVDDKSTHL